MKKNLNRVKGKGETTKKQRNSGYLHLIAGTLGLICGFILRIRGYHVIGTIVLILSGFNFYVGASMWLPDRLVVGGLCIASSIIYFLIEAIMGKPSKWDFFGF